MPPYEKEFARVYDFVVEGKEEKLATETESNFIRQVFRQSPRQVREILDIGCGKGRFLVPLAQTGYELTGVDYSPGMLEECRLRLKKRNLQAELILQDYEAFAPEKRFDAVICMDSVICYVLETEKIISTLAKFRRMLRPQGIFILDIWNMLAQYELIGKVIPHRVENEKIQIKWSERYLYEDFTSIFHGIFRGTFTENGVTREFYQEEILRAMTVGEVKMYLKEAGFINIKAYADFQFTNGAPPAKTEAMIFVANNS